MLVILYICIGNNTVREVLMKNYTRVGVYTRVLAILLQNHFAITKKFFALPNLQIALIKLKAAPIPRSALSAKSCKFTAKL
jgi:hypothetical protein